MPVQPAVGGRVYACVQPHREPAWGTLLPLANVSAGNPKNGTPRSVFWIAVQLAPPVATAEDHAAVAVVVFDDRVERAGERDQRARAWGPL
jgi:hypothetical protein